VLQPASRGRRRVVLATNVAESSVTLPGVRVVIDSGLAREPRFDPNSGFSRLATATIAQASADQRAGRAGRVARLVLPAVAGVAAARAAAPPEIAQVELAGLALELAAWGSDDLRFVDPPPPGALAAARDLLRGSARSTATARSPRSAGACSRSARIRGWRRCCWRRRDPTSRALACDLAALIEARDPLRGTRSR
jgi:ATP-dependent helicase HrpB